MNSWDSQETILMNEGKDGIWDDPLKCPKDSYIDEAQATLEKSPKPVDDSYLISLNIKCRNPKISYNNLGVKNDHTIYGVEEFIKLPNKYVCGAEIGENYPLTDTPGNVYGLHGLAFKFCDFEYDFSQYKVAYNGSPGVWLNPVEAQTGYYTCGMRLKNKGYQTSQSVAPIDALEFIYCSINQWSNRMYYKFNDNKSVNWVDEVMCPRNSYVYGVKVKISSSNDSKENTGIYGIELKCKDSINKGDSKSIQYDFDSKGVWRDSVEVNRGRFVCGGQVKSETSDSNAGGSGALHGLEVKFCVYGKLAYEVMEEGKQGKWLEPIDVPGDDLACGISLKYSTHKIPGAGYPIDAVKIIYCGSDWATQGEISLNEGLDGSWKKNMMCPQDCIFILLELK